MAELSVFAYRRLDTPLHALDARVKLAALMAVSTTTLAAGPLGMIPATVLAAAGIRYTQSPLGRVFHDLRYFLLLVLCVWVLRAWQTPGEPLLSWWPAVALTRQGAADGALLCWRWIVIVLLGMGMCATTRTADIRGAVEWFLHPLPWVRSHTVGTMLGLLLRFIPVILTQAREIADAQRARAVENRKNPAYRMGRLGIPLLQRTFLTADRLAMAMDARCFGDRRTPHTWRLRSRDRRMLILTAVVCILMIIA